MRIGSADDPDEELLDSAAMRQPRTFVDGVETTRQVDEAIRNRLRAEMKFPAYRPPLNGPWLTDDESVWLRRADDVDQMARWIVLTRDGDLEGELALPRNALPLWSRADTLWAAVPDDFDVPWLVRYQIAR